MTTTRGHGTATTARTAVLALGALVLGAGQARAADDYVAGPDSLPQPGVPRGTVVDRGVFRSRSLYPGTERRWWLYVPAQYDGQQPAALIVFQDGWRYIDPRARYRADLVLDNLIHRKELPVTLGVFLEPGELPPARPGGRPRVNRAFEYESLGDRYARFLLEEVLPELAKDYRFTADPAGRALVGQSSGGSCVFNAAWERPDAFGKVLSTIGSFIDLKGAFVLPTLVRKNEPRPIRVFLQDGANDKDSQHGSFPLANHEMAAALAYAGYDHAYAFGDGGHNGRHAATILPEALRWLFRDHPGVTVSKPMMPAPLPPLASAGSREGQASLLTRLFPEGSAWEVVGQGRGEALALAVDAQGEVFFSDAGGGTIQRAGPGKEEASFGRIGPVRALAFGVDGRLLAAGGPQIVVRARGGPAQVVAGGVNARDLVVTARGDVYATDPRRRVVWHVDPRGRKRVVARNIDPIGLALWPDHGTLVVTDTTAPHLWAFRIELDGSLAFPAPFYGPVQTPPLDHRPHPGGVTVDEDGHVYAATASGIQVFDGQGRRAFVLAAPGGAPPTDVAFGGPERDYLYVIAGDKVYRRKTNVRGPRRSPEPRRS